MPSTAVRSNISREVPARSGSVDNLCFTAAILGR
jgi:hypothetical protein